MWFFFLILLKTTQHYWHKFFFSSLSWKCYISNKRPFFICGFTVFVFYKQFRDFMLMPIQDSFNIFYYLLFTIILVYKDDVIRICTKCKNCLTPSCQDKFWRSVLILVPVRLGSDALNPIYIPCLEVSEFIYGWCTTIDRVNI